MRTLDFRACGWAGGPRIAVTVNASVRPNSRMTSALQGREEQEEETKHRKDSNDSDGDIDKNDTDDYDDGGMQ